MPEGSGVTDQGNPCSSPSQAAAPLHSGKRPIKSNHPTERPFMSDNRGAACNRDTRLENFAAELTSAAYAVALRHGAEDKWLDLELELSAALKETCKKSGQAPAHFSDGPF